MFIVLIIIGIIAMVAQQWWAAKHGYKGGGSKGFIGGAKQNLGVMGLSVILLGSLAFGNCLALQGA